MNIKPGLFVVWRLLKVIFCTAVFLITFIPMMHILACFILPWFMGGHNLYSYIRYSRKSTDQEGSDWDDWLGRNFANIMLFPFPQILGKDLKK